MAEVIADVSATKKQSIARVELFTDARFVPPDRRLVIHFEDGLYDLSGNLIGETQFGTRRVERSFGEIASESVTASGATVTIAQIADLIAAASYLFRQQDIDAETE
jgi:hypothetical protein